MLINSLNIINEIVLNLTNKVNIDNDPNRAPKTNLITFVFLFKIIDVDKRTIKS